MLKALELAGFKSFADTTRFEFPAGITVVVGPNGSGKSNVVDAIKWVFGEQSVKSLRGTEMVDVVFNGSATRPASQTAEATLVLENVDGRFPVDTREVEVTRRVYRSGEGEYLINRQPCRRRDIVELFAGTGIGTHAYCIIEQGKVDLLLQSSPKDRRMIFEEAAGISRFKAKKLETQRRLERVEQNLARLSDIVQEVEGRLKTIRLQAGKATKYREYSERLQSLRTQAASMDWRNLKAREEEAATRRTAANAANEDVTARLERVEARGLELDVEVTEVTRVAREAEARASKTRELIAAREAGLAHERNRISEANREVEHWKQELEASQQRLSELSQADEEAAEAVRVAERDVEEGRGEIDAVEEELKVRQGALDAAKAVAERLQRDRLELLDSLAHCGKRLSQAEARHEAMLTMANRVEEQLRDWERQVDQRRLELDKARGEVARIQGEIEAAESELGKLDARVSAQKKVVDDLRSQLSECRSRHGVDSQRANFLEELEQRQEGIHVAVREVLARAKSSAATRFPALHGMIADLFRVQIDMAPLIEIALGERAQYLVVERRQALLDYLSRTAFASQGRVGFAWLDARPPSKSWYGPDWMGREGVVARADRLVDVDTQYVALASRLLGRTWIVRDLAVAEELAGEAIAGTRFVTGEGELLDSDVGLVIGPRQAATGIISRRSESRELQRAIARHIKAIERLEKEEQSAAETLGERVASFEDCRVRLGEAQLILREERSRCQELERRLDEQEAERAKLERHLAETRQSVGSAKGEIDAATKERNELGLDIEAKKAEGAAAAGRVAECESRREEWLRGRGTVELAIAAKQHRLDLERARYAEAARQLDEARASGEKMNSQLGLAESRVAESERKVADHEAEIERLFQLKESNSRESVELAQRRDALESDLRANSALAKELHGERRRTEAALHEVELSLQETRQKRLALEERFLEECGIDLTTLDGDDSTAEELAQRDEMDREIEVLRRKLNSLGNINMEALSELDSLETRFAALSGQYDDLHKAKATLEQIIHRINADSRRMFAETLATIRGHFEELFRRLFGGGVADIVLEDGVDILESGIEIVARPPGKQLRGVSLLSGGEKTLTCVALLLAFFKSRPSPFCVLDEVDAALDEANIGRFISVIQGFLTGTQFIVVTHSKRTMGAADTLYGVTMQESGVSRRVSVRFSDLPEDGAITLRPEDETDAA